MKQDKNEDRPFANLEDYRLERKRWRMAGLHAGYSWVLRRMDELSESGETAEDQLYDLQDEVRRLMEANFDHLSQVVEERIRRGNERDKK